MKKSSIILTVILVASVIVASLSFAHDLKAETNLTTVQTDVVSNVTPSAASSMSSAISGSQSMAPILPILPSDLSKAGYSGIRVQPPKGSDYQAPTAYFWVNEVSQADSTNPPTDNLLMVAQHYEVGAGNDTTLLFDYGLNRQPISITGATGFETKLVHDPERVAVNFIKGNHYIVIIGPNAEKVQALATIIAARI